jgi:hypothetical protein
MTKTFFSFKPFTQRVILLSLFSGLILGIFFAFSDLTYHSWWANKSYIPNILAAFTGFLVGAPVALVILATFTGEREEKATLDRVNRLSALAWDSFRDVVRAFTPDDRYELIVDQARDIKKYYDETTAAIDEYIESANQVLGDPHVNDSNDVNLDDHIEHLKQIESNFRTAVNAVRQNINFFETQDEWAQIVGAWRVLDQYVRLQRLEQDLEWFDKMPDSGLRKWLSREGNPLQELLDAIEIRRYTPNISLNVETMANALDTLAAYIRMSANDLGQHLLYRGNIFTPDRSSAYHIKRDAAQLFILDLQRYIGLVEMSYWPYSQTKPKQQDVQRELNMNEWIGSLQTPEGRKNFEKEFKRVAAEHYQDKLRRRPKGNLSGPEMRAIEKARRRRIRGNG